MKNNIGILILMVIMVLFLGCNGDPEPDPDDKDFTITSVTVSPGNITLERGASYDGYTATVAGTGTFTQNVNWFTNGGTGTTISGGVLTIAENEARSQVTVTAASADDEEVSGNGTVIVVAAGGVTAVEISPSTISREKGTTSSFTATVTGSTPSQAVRWSVHSTGHAAGTFITATGSLTIDAAETASTITIRAVAIQNGTTYGEAVITVVDPGAGATVEEVNITSPENFVNMGSTLQFEAEVIGTNSPIQDVTWSIVTTGLRGSTTIDPDGLLTVASWERTTVTSITVRAVSQEDTSKFDEVTVDLNGDFYHPIVRSGERAVVVTDNPNWEWQIAQWLLPLNGSYTMTFYQRGGTFRHFITGDDNSWGFIVSESGNNNGVVVGSNVWRQITIQFTLDGAENMRFVISGSRAPEHDPTGDAYFDDFSLTLDGGDGTNLIGDPGFESGDFGYNGPDDNDIQKSLAGLRWWGNESESDNVYFYTIDD